MRFVSTGGEAPAADLATALLEGLAPDGGLYLPERLEPLPASFFARLPGLGLVEIAEAVAAALLGDAVPAPERRRLLSAALDFPVPLVELGDGIRVLELFHGPTLAFKDVGARVLARLLAHLLRGSERPLTVLVATSGDTGSAVGHAFFGVPGTRVAILYPRGQVSPLQERQLTTLGGNVRALAVAGTFDDCQRMVKHAFGDRELRRELLLTSANSINLGRLLPQTFYYLAAVAQLPAAAPPALFAVPSGNFGNLTAGLIARRLGMPAAGFVAATNVNDVVPEYLATGVFSPRPSQRTLSNAMDVGDPSNFARMQALYGGDLAAIRGDVEGYRFDDQATREAVRRVHRDHGYLLDPHSAVGWLALRRALAGRREPASGVLLATAHPAKFRDVLEPVIGRTVPLPERLAACLTRPAHAEPLAADPAALGELLLGWE